MSKCNSWNFMPVYIKKKTQKKQTFERSGEILYKILWLKSLFLTESDIKVIKLTGE